MSYVHSADEIKIVLMRYFRFDRSFDLVATEYANMDVIALDLSREKFVEVEIKISKPDLLKDAKKPKHSEYIRLLKNTPKQFYYAVPKKLVDEAIRLCNILNPSYGVINVENYPGIVKRAMPLHIRKNDDYLVNSVISRVTSENINLRLKLNELKPKKERVLADGKFVDKEIEVAG